MSTVTLSVMLRSGETLQIEESLTADQCERFLSSDEGVRLEAEDEILERIRRIEGWDSEAMRQLWLSVDEDAVLPAGARSRTVVDTRSVWGRAPRRRLASCRSLLGFAARALPRADRQGALEEWVDELECAAAEGLSISRRTASILFRAAPVLALRGRRPRRAGGRR